MRLLKGSDLRDIRAIAFSSERTLKGTKNATCKNFKEEGPKTRHLEDPMCVVVKVDNKRSYVYNIKKMTRTAIVPTAIAMSAVRVLNGGKHEEQGIVGASSES